MGKALWSMLLLVLNFMNSLSGVQNVAGDILRGCNSSLDVMGQILESPELRRSTRGKMIFCNYLIEINNVTDGDILKFEFQIFNVGRIINKSICAHAYLKIIDGINNITMLDSTSPGQFCGELEIPRIFYSETSSVLFSFYADEYSKDSYFKILYEPIDSFTLFQGANNKGEILQDRYCDRIFEGSINEIVLNEIRSPGYNGIYLPYLNCTYLVNPINNSQQQLILKLFTESEFDVGSSICDDPLLCETHPISTNCSSEYIAIYDGKSSESKLITRFCGKGYFTMWPQLIPSTNFLYISFISLPVKSPINFGFRFTLSKQDILDNFPGRSPPHLLTNGSCFYTFLSIENIAGVFGSINHWYPKNTTCTFRFMGNSEERVKITFDNFYGDKECNNYLILYDSWFPDSDKIVGKYCSYWSPKIQYSTNSDFFIVFHSINGSFDGTQMTFSAAYEFKMTSEYIISNDCHMSFNSSYVMSGSFHIPRNSLLWRNKRLNCTYTFKGRNYEQVLITVNNSTLTTSSFCIKNDDEQCVDKSGEGKFIEQVTFHDSDGSYLGCLCGTENFPLVFISLQNTMTINIELENWTITPPDISELNFIATFQFVTYDCPLPHQQGLEGIIITPNHPLNMTLPIRCRWTIDVSPRRYLFLLLDDFDLSGDCQTDYLRIFQIRNNKIFVDICEENYKSEWILQEMILDEFFFENVTRPTAFEIQTSKPGAKLQLYWNEVSAKSKQFQELECPHMCPDQITCIEKSLVCNDRRNCPLFLKESEDDDLNCLKKSTIIDEETLILICCAGALGLIVAIWLIVCCVRQWHEYCG